MIIMEYQRVTNLVDKTPNQPSKLMAKNWVEINEDVRGVYNNNSQTKFKTAMLKKNKYNHSNA